MNENINKRPKICNLFSVLFIIILKIYIILFGFAADLFGNKQTKNI